MSALYVQSLEIILKLSSALSVSPAYSLFLSCLRIFCSYASAHVHFHGIRARGLRTSAADKRVKKTLTGCKVSIHRGRDMDRGMASSLPTEKLDRSNYASWSYKMHQYLLGHGYWSFVEGTNEVAPEPAHKDFPVWEQGASRVLYCLASCVHDQMLGYIKDAKTPKVAWENLRKIFAASTTTRKLQLRQELNNIRQRDMSVTDYTTKIKQICDALGSINVTVDEDEMVQICLGGLAQRYGPIRTTICT
mgnify:CR=1 FL=1